MSQIEPFAMPKPEDQSNEGEWERERRVEAENIVGLLNAWPLNDVLKKLVEAAEILLHKNSYDGHSYEEINHCVERGKEILAAMEAYRDSTGPVKEVKSAEEILKDILGLFLYQELERRSAMPAYPTTQLALIIDAMDEYASQFRASTPAVGCKWVKACSIPGKYVLPDEKQDLRKYATRYPEKPDELQLLTRSQIFFEAEKRKIEWLDESTTAETPASIQLEQVEKIAVRFASFILDNAGYGIAGREQFLNGGFMSWQTTPAGKELISKLTKP